MENKRIVYNNEQYVILASVKIGSTAFLICINSTDKKIIYFKQEVVDGKVKLTSKTNLLTSATEVNKVSLSNKKRILDSFIVIVEHVLENTVFVDKDKVAVAFKKLSTDVDSCDLKYYVIENASIEPTDDSINALVDKYRTLNFNKDLEQVEKIQNDQYYYNTAEETEEKKEKEVSNANKLSASNDDLAPLMATDPFANVDASTISANLSQTQNIEKLLQENIPVTKVNEQVTANTNSKKGMGTKILLFIILIAVLTGAGLFGYQYINSHKKQTPSEIMDKILSKTSVKEIDEGVPYNAPEEPTSSYRKAYDSKLIDVNLAPVKALNRDTIAWINNDFLNINYPVLKGALSTYYSTHDFNKDQVSSGWIHTDSETDLVNLSYNNVIYGSSSVNNSLFYNLKRTLTVDFAKNPENQVIKISTPSINTSWLVFSAYEIENEDYYMQNKFETVDDYASFLTTIYERSIHDFKVSLNTDDKILTLTTNKDSATRYVVHAKLIKVDIKDESVKLNSEEEDDIIDVEKNPDDIIIDDTEKNPDNVDSELKGEKNPDNMVIE